ncbi:hypothetical protein M0D69_42995 [Caballeronia sp. SEWSISQ10-4 2]|uniref:hypothetical protein n=1 Tax=Caballeronia sp. SEWSISQ10-4 2 TaxID=2937438 RepID=UPI00264E876F|nr:hypothetical protein [Caballeronia sp. SEWSISQ10-4 2]MDN7184669.1 hypothetical protein [Caballeronia sp. SEWSISQ10-4 2]
MTFPLLTHRERFLKSYEARCFTVVDSRIRAKRRYIHTGQSAISWYATRIIKKAMSNPTQQEFLKSAKDALGVTWDELAESAGINPRALKTYRMPDTSKDYRPLPALARAAVDRLVSGRKTKSKINA